MATTAVTIEEYLSISYRPDCDYIDGEVQERNLGEFDHARLQTAIAIYFGARRKEWGIRVFAELRVQVAATRFRVPDVTVLDRDRPVEQIITQPPLAVFEILSPEDSLQRLKRKLEDYATMGIAEIWVIDPQDATYYRYQERQLLRNDSFSCAPKGIAFPMDRIKECLD